MISVTPQFGLGYAVGGVGGVGGWGGWVGFFGGAVAGFDDFALALPVGDEGGDGFGRTAGDARGAGSGGL